MKRLIVCQGSAQLVTAVAVVKQRKKFLGVVSADESDENYLLIAGLSVPDSQAIEFSQFIEIMAQQIFPLQHTVTLSDKELASCCGVLNKGNLTESKLFFYEITKIKDIDEVYVVRDWQDCNFLLLNLFPEAKHICYGDSVGLYIPREYLSEYGILYSVVIRMALFIQSLFKPYPSRYPRIDFKYFLIEKAFGHDPSGVFIKTSSSYLNDIFFSLKKLIDEDCLKDLLIKTKGKRVKVLMGSNFSEQSIMSVDNEALAYKKYIEMHTTTKSDVLIIKSHPRDSIDKHNKIISTFKPLFDEVIDGDLIASPYLPFEVILAELKMISKELQVFTFSSACISTAIVMNIKTKLGFEENVTKLFFKGKHYARRIKHEQDLKDILTKRKLIKND